MITNIIYEEYVKLLKESELITEYITNESISLLRYLQQTPEEIKKYLPHQYPYPYLFEEWVEDFTDLDVKDYNIYQDDFLGELKSSHPDVYRDYADYLYINTINFTLDVEHIDYPAWAYFNNAELVKNQWMVHFTDSDPVDIALEGFTYGMDDQTKLGLTTFYGDFDKKYGGYNFAYTLHDFPKYYKSFRRNKYGENVVVFNASGIKAWHVTDEEPQVMFYGNTAKNIIPITSSNEVISVKTDRVLYEGESIIDSIKWVTKNYEQYRKHLMR